MDESHVKKPITIAQRFGGFAATHIAYSLLCLLSLYLAGSGIGLVGLGLIWWMLPLTLVALYFPLGMLIAQLTKWTPPGTGRERRLAILLPTLVAWTWVCVVLVMVVGEWEEPFMAILAISFFFAAPSSILVTILIGPLSQISDNLILSLGLSGLISGLLPPLLFALGSFWQAGRRKKKEERIQNG